MGIRKFAEKSKPAEQLAGFFRSGGIYGETLYPIFQEFSGLAPYPPNFRVAI